MGGHTAIEARVTHLLRKVGEVVGLDVLANRLLIDDPLALDVLSTGANELSLDILPVYYVVTGKLMTVVDICVTYRQ